MADIKATWKRLADRSPVIEFVDACLRGVAQVMLQNNPLTGLVILIAIAWGAFDSGNPRLLGGAVVGVVVGTLTAILLRADRDSLRSGLFGFSPLLTGIGVLLFLRGNALVWLYVVFGAAATTVVTLAWNNIMKTWGSPAFTFPFVLTTWTLLMGVYQLVRLRLHTPTPPTLPGHGGAEAAYFDGDTVLGMFEGVAQVFLIASWISGIIILIGLAINSLRSALFALIGTVVAALLAIWFEAGAKDVESGLWSFNAVLTAIALGGVLFKPSVPAVIYALFGIVATVFIQAMLATVLAPYGIPTLTAPFVLATWMFLLAKENFTPIPQHKSYRGGLMAPLRPDVGKKS
ncbi:urea transporter [Micromonospora sonneratiae]|uniref:Urea transporter n=1 Tax=Micromonospora sonneratiae TaxID=1184706 RepID=A0ABW3YPF9_9ACTN